MIRCPRALAALRGTSCSAAPRLVSIGVVLLSACAGPEARDDVAVRDSASITIVENAAPGAGAPRWRLADAPDVVIGALEGPPEEQLFQVRTARRLPDGRIAVANGGTSEIRFFDTSGSYLETIGRDGEGPGEFRNLGGLFTFEDSLFVPDFQVRRVSALGADGTFARAFPFPRLGERSSAVLSGIFGDGTLLVKEGRIFFAGEETSGVHRDSVAYLRMDRAGAIIDTLGTFPGSDAYVHADGRSMSVRSLIFGLQPSAAAGGRRFYYGSGESYEVRALTTDGVLERIIRLDRPPRTVTPADVERAHADVLDAVSDPGFRARMERMFAAMPIPPTMPAFSGLEVDAHGNVWVQSYRVAGDESSTWTVFEADGRLLAEIDTPPGFMVYQIGTDWLLGRSTDEFEVERVELYRFSRDGA